ncbi:ATP-NAD kinase-like domain-containing protein [Suillus paluster]|uniref:ATP-NAD kinase-like domain-containing protein n=1 Tax=Suillus paluster TaxID=48578 RepID=UPI001B86AEDD|nr:ATP-NAD kinase-like domain-containing protein [Suillus paluster]KAG1756721.1 ATP-NAD kinase-like domain-containing protein [Suillus paluster]
MPQVIIDCGGVSTSLRFNETTFFVEPTELDGHKSSCCTGIFHSYKEVKSTEVPLRNVVSAKFATGAVEVRYLVREGKEMRLKLSMTRGAIKDEDSKRTKEWCEALLRAAYQGANPSKNLKVLVNPHGGLDTTRSGHALEIAREMKLGYDALHQHREKAFRMPIVPIPTGSANGMSLNLLGLQDGLDVCAAALNVLKGQPLKTDLFSFTQGDHQRISFMSQTIGLIADADIETENLRWMGDTRFILGYIRAVIARKSCPIELSMKVVDQDKSRMMDALDDKKLDGTSSSHGEWTRFEKPILWDIRWPRALMSSTRDFMPFPVSLADDGLIDISVLEITSRRNLLRAVDGAEEGRPYWMNSNRYFKASAYRARPLAPTGTLVVDGEQVPFEEFQVDVLHRLGTFLSPYPYYAPEFVVQDAQGKTRRTSV